MKLLRAVALISGIYDLLLGGSLLFALEDTRILLGVEEPRFPIQANLNGLFALAVGAGYFAVWKCPQDHIWYLWIMGVLLKGGGAILFLLDQLLRDSPPAFLLFAGSDGGLALLTLYALTRDRERPDRSPARGPDLTVDSANR